ncbi:MAG: MupG family TIM beta-alpha barrel fold protein [Megasphaera sp.]|jgi:hypothetical protein|nr:MupG family TIM beta-alpha barrel fold protein [Megasphaera sp.]MCH4187686.1 MupG family TIM beta-alpha barrel fold protein [Megasphaera sp.]MCH4217585.1 MupG family TIM beta-alpha barrel fold protein [Megasphaera sp.]
MQTGISIYPGLGGSAATHTALLEKAAAAGVTRIFTSLHIPETNIDELQEELHGLLEAAQYHHMDVAADVSPATQKVLKLDTLTPNALLELGITTVRFDFGFDISKIALFSKAMHIQLNASTVQPSYIQELRQAGADFAHIEALHNFYPRPHTGLGEDYVRQQSAWLQDEGIAVGAFIPSQSGRRGPLFEGLPTLELHRPMDVSLTSRHIAAMGLQSVFIGDSAPSQKELNMLTRTGREEKKVVVIKARLLSHEPYVRDLLSSTFTARLDPARDAIRTQESRHFLGDRTIEADGPFRSLRRGDITIDNADYHRYMGEVQLLLTNQLAEERTNIVAEIMPNELFLLPYITPGRKFRLELIR